MTLSFYFDSVGI